MSDSPASTPPKPKPGSLRDRIAAFENKATANTVPERPPPSRPKPAGFAGWKPKQPSPPASPGTSTTSGVGSGNADTAGAADNVTRGGPGGMNAADAKESITRAGGSLKERMAALQGKGGFGAPVAPSVPAPRPAVERPKWKPPPQVATQPAVGEDDERQNQLDEGMNEEAEGSTVNSNPPSIKSPPPIPKSPPPIIQSPPSTLEDDASHISGEGKQPQENSEGIEAEPIQVAEEEEERQRRVALAARMAKLGGARIGMGPLVFGQPAIPPPTKKHSIPAPALDSEVETLRVEGDTPTESTEAPDTSPRPPTAMPMAAIPKRTAPPRRKPAKSTSITSPEASPVPPAADVPAAISLTEETTLPSVPVNDITAEAGEKIVAEPDTIEAHDSEPKPEATSVSEEKPEEIGEGSPVREEDDEEARKKRVAEKLAKMGGINPFASPLVRRPSAGSAGSAEGAIVSPPSSPPIPTRKSTLPGSSRPAPADKPLALKRASGGSFKSFDSPSGVDVPRRASVGSVTSVKSTSEVAGVGRRASVGSVRSVTKQEGLQEVHGIVEEPESIVQEDDISHHAPAPRMESNEPVVAKDENDERNTHDSHQGEIHDEDTQSDERTNNDEDDEDFEATPQPPPRVPYLASSLSQQESTRGRSDPGIVGGVLPPLPRSPPASTSIPVAAITRTRDVPLPPRIVPASRDHSIDRDRLSGPAPPRRIVPQTPEPQTPEQPTRGLDDHDTSASEVEGTVVDGEEAGSELAQSALFIPPVTAGSALRSILSAEVDDGEESEPPLRVPPPPGSAGLVAPEAGRREAYEDTDDESNASGVALAVRLSVARNLDTIEAVKPSRPLPPPPPPITSVRAPPTPAEQDNSGSDYGDDVPHEQEHREEHVVEERVLHTRPLSDDLSQSISSSVADLTENIPLIVPLRLTEGGSTRHAPARSVPPPPPPGLLPASLSPSSSPHQQHYEDEEKEEKEVLDEDEGDPIDPAFHSPSRRASYVPGGELEQAHTLAVAQVAQGSLSPSSAAMRSPPPVPLSPPLSVPTFASVAEPKEQEQAKSDDDDEKGKRQTIAERMARLGGIKFGAAPGLGGSPPVRVPPARKASTGETTNTGEDQGDEPDHEKAELARERVENSGNDGDQGEDEEEERMRRERIAAKLAGMGGMRIGMMPMAMPPRQSHVLGSEPQQSAPPTSAPPKVLSTAKGSDASESGASEDGVKVEVEESEIEEVGYDEAKVDSEEGSGEDVPPPPPPRIPIRRGTGASVSSAATATSPTSPSTSTTRPPVPVPGPFRRASMQSVGSTRKTQQPVQAQPSEYVLVDEPRVINEGVEGNAGDNEEEDIPPPPPARPQHRAPIPTRVALPVPPAPPLGDSISQWELPTIPSSSFGGDLSASWSEERIDENQQALPPPLPPQQNAPVPVPPPAAAPASWSPEALHLNPDELMATWGRVGVQICEVATTMHDHSKKTLIGDGTYRGFVDAVLREVPNTAKPQSKQIPYGYLVYLQNGAQVQKRASDIMPGDVVEIMDAKFKGHKGLGGYQQQVGIGVEGGEGGGPVVGVICEFEPKKSKIRVFQANQHVGQQTVESVSYRLDDLKSGLVKVYRVLEAQ